MVQRRYSSPHRLSPYWEQGVRADGLWFRTGSGTYCLRTEVAGIGVKLCVETVCQVLTERLH